MQFLDHFIIGVSSLYDQGEGDIKKINPAYFIDKERDRYERKNRHGKVISVPLVYRELNHTPIDPGLPTPRIFIGHDDIQQKINEGYRWSNANYHPSTAERVYEYITVADYGRMITAKAGDMVWFHPSVTEDENYLGEKDGLSLYKAAVTEIICCGDIPQGGHVIVEPVGLANERDGILLAVEDQDEALRGRIKYARPGSGLEPGTMVYFQENANWEYWMDGVRYFAMLEENILLREAI